jgi:hypothetical protein
MKLTGILFLLFTTFSLSANAQEETEREGGLPSSAPASWSRGSYCYKCKTRHYHSCTPTTPPPTNVPIDGGLGVLLAAGAAYGVKRMRKNGLKEKQ